MAWDLDADRPIYAQLVERIQMQIVSGQYLPGGKLPSVRDLAAVAAVNPNTMQKAFAELERSGLIITQRTNGRTVTEDEEMIRKIRAELAREHVDMFFAKMKELGYSEQDAVDLVKKKYEGEKE
ncbi:MAG: GntR family transcriptional regulator [Lachnospiraceae bacterium]|nr:GntR family transcriptional regulator [Lachnospiraceae bacterium]